ncbi:MAG: bifunctional precorrin-2 dehydrogenase/sirohydrochlorin ferrochelatase [Cytophagaceae bacterium]|nr:bifunctional precorrin-2 dehydrogenase/sirohydrochlorin ferrochelatase [Cytophagaceae bacterium]
MTNDQNSGNQLFPIFLRLDQLQLLIVGGGAVGLEKVSAILKNSSNANITLIAPEIREEIKALSDKFKNLKLIQREYQLSDLEGKDLVIVATSLHELNKKVREDAKSKKILTNVADTPDICDFYLSSVVKKGDLKIAISTNGKSPTFAKRIREMLEDVLPDGMDSVMDNLKSIREKLKGDFEYKVKKLNEITSLFREKGNSDKS